MNISGRKGVGYLAHNNRDFIPQNVNQQRTPYNHTFKRQSLEKAYDICFKEAFESYNNSIRKDRRFQGSYLEKLRSSKSKHPPKEFYEWIVQVGDKRTCGYGTQNEALAEKILNEYMKGFIKRNPQLYIFNAVMHRDESTPHIHIDFIPMAYFEKGQKIRNSLDKALEQMGYGKSISRKKNNTMEWQRQEREALRQLAREKGLDIEDEHQNKNKHLDNESYKALAKELESQKQELSTYKDIYQKSLIDLVQAIKKKPEILSTINRAVKIALGKESLPKENLRERSR